MTFGERTFSRRLRHRPAMRTVRREGRRRTARRGWSASVPRPTPDAADEPPPSSRARHAAEAGVCDRRRK